jgi:hypothetical protein
MYVWIQRERQQRIGHDIKICFICDYTQSLGKRGRGQAAVVGGRILVDNLYSYTVIEPSVMILLILHLSRT